MSKYILLKLFIVLSIALLGQNDIYKHFRGKLGENMYVNANIQEVNGKILGTYYYTIKSGEEVLSESPLIALEGKKVRENYTFSEKDNKDSQFLGVYNEKTKTIIGNWSTAGRKIAFNWRELYKESSIPLKTIRINRFFPLKEKVQSSKATFNATLFYPEKSNLHLYRSYIKFIKRMLETDTLENDFFKLLAIYKDEYFDRYYKNNIGKYSKGENKTLNWSQKLDNQIYFNDKNILAIYFTKKINTGGSVDLEMIYTANFDLKTGKEINYESLFVKNYQSKLKQVLADQLREDFMIEENQSFTEVGFFVDDIPLASNYLLTNKGIIFFYNVYELAGNSFGKIEVFLDYEKLSSILSDKGIL